MILAPFLSSGKGIWREQILVILDAASYGVLAIVAVMFAPGLSDDGGAFGSMALFLTVSTIIVAWRHIRFAISAINDEDSPSGTDNGWPPIVIPAEHAKPVRASLPYWIPVSVLCFSLIWLYIDPSIQNIGPRVLMLLASWSHFGFARWHGDHNGGKYVPTVFALMLHLAASLCGTPPRVTLSIHRAMMLFTYFFTGFRKVYVTGIRWADGTNLQFMMALNGLYQDNDQDDSLAFNLMLAANRTLCRVGSLSVLSLQLFMPFFLLVDSMYPSSQYLAFKVAFWLAMSFHASNHILWRINFSGSWCPALIALLLPMGQIPPFKLWRCMIGENALGPTCVFIAYCIMQMGHALNMVSEKKAKALQKRILSTSPNIFIGKSLQSMAVRIVTIFEFHLVGGYYASYWPEEFQCEDMMLACVLIKWNDGEYESLLPAPVDFYFRRIFNAWIEWPRQLDDTSDMLIKIKRVRTPGGSALADPTAPVEELKLSTVLQRIATHHEVFLCERVLRDIRANNAKVYLRLRGVIYKGTGLFVERFWERELPIGRRQ